ncbi:hypothetical protein HMPREF1981_02882 [Bacteroides pyogenes F0041]|uniref:Uncharacterized protein n=1 Tax=Bacteroides pyogenes F0041 TaxID=1321819 RepID=U2DQ42_9BACE|nr:hypothetical protein HMPREF1981_02882 [Bacteroides pyogenes F0041]
MHWHSFLFFRTLPVPFFDNEYLYKANKVYSSFLTTEQLFQLI